MAQYFTSVLCTLYIKPIYTLYTRHNKKMGRLTGMLFFLLVLFNTNEINAQEKLKVALVSGAHSPSYEGNYSMRLFRDYLKENDYPIEVVFISSQEGTDAFLNLDKLEEVDAAVFNVRRKTPSAEDLAIFREFFNSGKGFVAIRSTSHAWENWPDFDQEVLGVSYNMTFHADGQKSPSMEVINLYNHPVFTGVRDFSTDQYMYDIQDVADDVQIIMEGTVGESTTPMAWTRTYKGGRVFRLVPGNLELFQDPNYLKMVANGLLWVAGRTIPGSQTQVQRTYMPGAHPGSFAVTFPQGPGICFDPVRGGINYIWEGDFIDLRPRWLTKQGKPAKYYGEVFYSNELQKPIRTGSPDKESEYQFQGYRMVEGNPVFSYSVDGTLISETVTPLENAYGVKRHFRVEGKKPVWILSEPQKDSEITLAGAEKKGKHIHYNGKSDDFVVKIRKSEPSN